MITRSETLQNYRSVPGHLQAHSSASREKARSPVDPRTPRSTGGRSKRTSQHRDDAAATVLHEENAPRHTTSEDKKRKRKHLPQEDAQGEAGTPASAPRAQTLQQGIGGDLYSVAMG